MKNFSLIALLSLFVSLIGISDTQAQSETWVGGFIQVDYTGSPAATCADPLFYDITFHFYRDFIPSSDPIPQTADVILESRDLGVTQTITLGQTSNAGTVPQYCLNGSRVLTEGIWYSTTTPIDIRPAEDWKIFYAGQYRSNESNNINPQQRFYVETRLNNNYCDTIFGIRDGIYDTIINSPVINSVRFVDLDPVSSFCVGKQYDYSLSTIDPDNDNIRYDLTSAKTDNVTTAARYVQPAYPFDQPFPIAEPRLVFDNSTSTMSFTPTQPFTSLVTYRIVETRTVYYQGALVAAPDTFELLEKNEAVTTTFYEERFVIDDNCNDRLPDFIGVVPKFDQNTGQDRYNNTYNSLEDAYEFDCGTDTLTFNLTEPMFCATLDRNDFRIGLGYNRIDTIAAYIDKVFYANITPTEAVRPIETRMADCSPIGEFNQVTLILHKPLGPGEYNIYFRYGSNDNTTIKNRCDYELPLNQPYVKIYVNNDFTYDHPITNHTYCFPAIEDETPPFPRDSAFQTNSQFDPRIYYTWKLNPLDPNSPRDTVRNIGLGLQPDGKRWAYKDITIPRSNNPSQNVNTLTWEVGVGLDFSKYDPFTGDTLVKSICYDTDIFTVTRYENPQVNIPDYDLCPDDDFPVINLDTMVTKHNADPSAFIWARYLQTFDNLDEVDDYKIPANRKNWSVMSSGRPSLALPGQEENKFNVFATQVPLIINGYTCYERDTFVVVKNQVTSELRTEASNILSPNSPTDTTICPNDPFMSVNIGEYMFPDSMDYQWYLDDVIIPGANDSTYTIGEPGEYKVLVTKRSAFGSTCEASDSIRVNIADDLDSFRVACKDINFQNGIVIQNFNWDVSPGADGYEARGVRIIGSDTLRLPWEEANGNFGISHRIEGEQLGLEVRPYNNEVPEDAICRYGPIIYGQACDAIVRPINVFTPNGDGINDFLSFSLLELYPGSLLQIYNRWGELIFEDPDYYNDWDGEDFKEGVYYYVLKINDEIYPDPFTGHITIIR